MRILVAAAFAAAIIATPALAQDEDFSGFHIVAVGGAESTQSNGINKTGVVYGASVGFDGDVGGAIIGAEAEGTLGTVKWCTTGPVCVDSGRDLYGGVRIGKRISSNNMVYIKAGYTNARVNVSTGGPTVASTDLDGVRVGLGLEGRSKNMLFRAEYRYSNYEAGFTRHQIVLGVGFHF